MRRHILPVALQVIVKRAFESQSESRSRLQALGGHTPCKVTRETLRHEKNLSPLSSLSLARARPRSDGHDRRQRRAKYHDDVMAYDDRFRAAAGRLYYQQPKPFLQNIKGHEAMRDQYSFR